MYNYTFTGWTPAVVPATANATYRAIFNQEYITYEVGDSIDFGSSSYIKGIYHGKLIKVKYLKLGVTYFTLDGIDFEDSYFKLEDTNNARQYDEIYILRNARLYSTGTNSFYYCVELSYGDGTGTNYKYKTYNESLGEKVAWKCTGGDGTQDNPYTFDYVPYADVTWNLDENTVIDTTKVLYGDTPTHAVTDKENEGNVYYVFTGWTPDITAAAGDTEYTAVFTQYTYHEAAAPACDTDSNIEYYEDSEGNKFSDLGVTPLTSVIDPKSGHSWGDTTYTWSDVNFSCTATRVCGNDENHIETETVTADYSVVNAATCEQTGTGRFTTKAFDNTAFTVQTKDVEIAAAGHNYGAPTWNWNGTESAQAQFVCENNDDTQTVNATITSEVTTKPSYTTEGVHTYTAAVTFNGTPYTDTKTETINALTPPLENLSQVSSETITAGSKLTLTGAAQGGEGVYRYSYYYKRSTTNNWTTKLENTTKTTASITPGTPVPYDVKIVSSNRRSRKYAGEDLYCRSTAFAACKQINCSGVFQGRRKTDFHRSSRRRRRIVYIQLLLQKIDNKQLDNKMREY